MIKNTITKKKNLLEDYLEYKNDIQQASSKTIKAYRNDLTIMLPILTKATLDDMQVENISKITPKMVIDSLNAITNIAPSTKNRRMGAIRDFYKHYSNIHGFPNVLGNLSKIHDTREKEVNYMALDSMKKMIDCTSQARQGVKARDKYILTMLFNCGLRSDELLNLTEDRILQNEVVVLGKGGKIRRIPLNDKCKCAIDEYLAYRRSIGVMGGQMVALSYNGLRKLYSKYSEKANGVKCTSVHSSRHGYATALLSLDCDIQTISELLGHSSIELTSKTYLHSEKKEVASSLLNI